MTRVNPLTRVLRTCLCSRPGMAWAVASAVTAWLLLSALGALAAQIPIIDAHSQADHLLKLEKIIELMDKGGVSHTILSTRGKVTPEQLLAFAARHPGRITPSVRSKGKPYASNSPKYYRLLEKQMSMPGFGAIAEVLMWHAEKRSRAGEFVAPGVIVHPDDKRVRSALDGAIGKGWPFIIHIEFASAGADRAVFMKKMETMVASHPDHPFALIHMGQLGLDDVRQLMARHDNIYFLTSRSNSVVVKRSREPWTMMFEGKRLAPDWKTLVVRHPDRFVLAFDNVFARNWGKFYLKQVHLWRKALADLPPDVAHAMAHKNAERLWRLPPAN